MDETCKTPVASASRAPQLNFDHQAFCDSIILNLSMLGGKTTVPILTHRGEVIFSALFWRDGEMAIFDFDIGLTTGFFRESGYKGDWGITASHVELSLQFFDNAFGPTTIH